ncbi:TIR-like protein FxsC [Dactylosporangium sucinum]|uniref:TIR domain-containing protein n=1 Tax=Dactylosporangium sucinum TaxID=1424081 RepID=A0A917TVT8_9ACTN|nr:TIR-like protein FxsC [Dactylosporangium sucinum]GGM39709.1 hypothetical protein GCM10007977_046410 [Dactylosporangium sucinum]
MVEQHPPQAPDRRAPVFFLSYAETPRRDWVRQFFEELSDHVAELMGFPASGDVGFMNVNMGAGRVWSKELAFAVGHCSVFVALLSPRYYTSEWCAREWHAFASRLPDNILAPEDTAMLPVIWTKKGVAAPAMIDRLQRFQPIPPPDGIERRYGREGVYGLRVRQLESSDYDMVVWRLANEIADLAERLHVPSKVATDFEGLPGAFEEEPS